MRVMETHCVIDDIMEELNLGDWAELREDREGAYILIDEKYIRGNLKDVLSKHINENNKSNDIVIGLMIFIVFIGIFVGMMIGRFWGHYDNNTYQQTNIQQSK